MFIGAHVPESRGDEVGAGASLVAAIAGAVFVLAVMGYIAAPHASNYVGGQLGGGHSDTLIPISYTQGPSRVEWTLVEQPVRTAVASEGRVPGTVRVQAGVPVVLALQDAPSPDASVYLPALGFTAVAHDGSVTLPALEPGVYRIAVGADELWGTIVAE